MTTKDLLKQQMDDAGFQLEKALEGVNDAGADHKVCASAMSARETAEHLCEAYTAAAAAAAGNKHEWGSYSLEDKSWDNVMTTFRRLRSEAVAGVLAADEERAASLGSAFIIAHDYYHVGQLASSRIDSDGAWDPYSIYQH